MGITHVSDAFSTKYPTAQIFSHAGTWDIVPLKRVNSGLMFIKVRGQVYPFVLDSTKFKTYRYKGAKTIQTILYDIEDINPFDPHELRTIQQYGEKNGVVRFSEEAVIAVQMAYEYLEKSKEGDIVYIDELIRHNAESQNLDIQIQDMIEAVGTKCLVKPSPYIVDIFTRKINSDPKMISQGILQLKQENWEWRKIANPAKTPFQGWLVLFAIIGIIGVAGVGLWWANEEGYLSGDTGGVGDIDWSALQGLGSPDEVLGNNGLNLDPFNDEGIELPLLNDTGGG